MKARIHINVAVFAILGVALLVWAFTGVLRLDVIERPYRVTVEFESSPGLHPNFEVDYLGTRIGKIDSVELRHDRVVVRLDIDRDVRIPRGVTAAAARKSAVGEPVVELTPKPGRAAGPMMPTDGSARIPLEDTSVPPSYGELFEAVNDTLEAVDPEAAGGVLRELAEGWAGRQDSLRQIIAGTDRLTGTFARDTELIDGLTRDFGKIADVLSAHRAELGAGVDDLAALTAALRGVRTELIRLRDQGPTVLETVNELLAGSRADVECMLGALGSMDLERKNPQVYADLRKTLEQSGELVHVLNSVIQKDRGQNVLNVFFLVTLNTPATLEYKRPLPQPEISPVPACPGGRVPARTEQKDFYGKEPGETLPSHDAEAARRAHEAERTSASDRPAGPPTWLVWLPPLIALLVLIRVMAGAVPVLSRLRRRK
ncbi:MCE family protein [Thermomonospora catenispora]|uniref:MCE family protein n=1 Tax=Thermomonospora catenispora TaxID=2493090 RepID=UPI00112201C0|nr:MCE family protein [Thermomonospora catenispora]TNY38378.1 MCE family protein [Thermomonospora catenispora]